ncbi:MAG: EAL domain-containing protein [Candidatus Dormibacteria bacterium]
MVSFAGRGRSGRRSPVVGQFRRSPKVRVRHCRGVRIAIDDFGTGFSSLARLQHVPVDVIKLDRAFVIDVAERPEARTMAAAIFELSKAIGASIVAEGIETEAQATTLREIGYEHAQGFLFARPMPLAQLHALLESRARALSLSLQPRQST